MVKKKIPGKFSPIKKVTYYLGINMQLFFVYLRLYLVDTKFEIRFKISIIYSTRKYTNTHFI